MPLASTAMEWPLTCPVELPSAGEMLSQGASSETVYLSEFFPEFFTLSSWGAGMGPDSDATKEISEAFNQMIGRSRRAASGEMGVFLQPARGKKQSASIMSRIGARGFISAPILAQSSAFS